MFATYVVVTGLAAAANIYAATVDFARAEWILANMTAYGVPHSWLSPLGAVKAAGALGLLIGIGVPVIGIAAAAGLVLFFTGAFATVVRSHCYADIPYPTIWFLLAAGSLASRLAAL
jgi:DoxX-like family